MPGDITSFGFIVNQQLLDFLLFLLNEYLEAASQITTLYTS